MNIALKFLMLAAAAAMLMPSAAMPTRGRHHRERDIASTTSQQQQERFARSLNATTSTSLQYMRSLYEEYERENSKPVQSTDKPTDILCFPDKDIARETYREKLVKATKCETYTQYVFHWASVNEEMDSTLLEVDNGKLRAYIQTINRHITEGSSVDVTITAYMFPRNNASTNVTFNNTDFSEAVVAGEDTVSVTRDSDDWIELNVTEGFLDIWSSMPNNTEIQVILKAEVNCVEQKKVPINFVNPAEIPLEQENRRARHMDLQPLLVVFANNYESKKVLNREDEEEVMGEADNSTRSVIDIDNLNVRAKRSSNSECSLENYVVNLHNLGLANVVAPAELNISRCAGNCNNRLIINRLGTNHAKIMMAMYNAQISAGISADQATATAPCCVPTKYLVGYLLMNTHDNTVTMMRSYNKLIARECGCR